MPTGDPTHTSGALSRLRQRWFAPTRPLAVDDGPPGAERGDHAGGEYEDGLHPLPAKP